MTKQDLFKLYPIVSKLFESMPNSLFDGCSIVTYDKNQTIFSYKTNIQYVYVLCKGSVIILNENYEGLNSRVVFIHEGDTLGEMEALMGDSLLVYTAKSYTQCDLLKIPRDIFTNWMKRDANACFSVLKMMAVKLKDASKEVTGIIHVDSIFRLTKQLLEFQAGKIELSRAELAVVCGTSIRTINRCIKKLVQDNYITIDKGKIVISSEQQLYLQNSKYVATV